MSRFNVIGGFDHRRGRASVLALCAASILLTGCAEGQKLANDVEGLFGGDFATPQADPVCYVQRGRVKEHGEFFDEALVASAVLGGVTGAIIAASTGENVLAGAAIGAAGGLAIGYVSKISGVGPYQALTTALTDVQAENRKILDFTAALGDLQKCRQAEAKAVRDDLKAGKIIRPVAEERMAAVRMRHDVDTATAREVAQSISKKTEEYVVAYNEIAADNNSRGLVLEEFRPGNRSVRRTSVPQRQVPEGQRPSLAVAPNQRTDVAALEKECIDNVRKRDDCLETLRKSEKASGDGTFTL